MRDKVFCNMCHDHTTMTFLRTAKTKKNGDPIYKSDVQGRPVQVIVKYFGCPVCETLARFYFRVDGKVGDLHKMLDIKKVLKVPPPPPLAGRLDRIE